MADRDFVEQRLSVEIEKLLVLFSMPGGVLWQGGDSG